MSRGRTKGVTQRQVLDVICEHLDDAAVPPTLREIGAAVGITSPSAVRHHLVRLREAGRVDFPHRGARAITVLDALWPEHDEPIDLWPAEATS